MKKKIFNTAILLFFVLIGAAAFPIINFSKDYPNSLSLIMLITPIVLYYELGTYEGAWLRMEKGTHTLGLNAAILILSLVCRYLLEFGEASNSYNFTVPNIAVHFVLTLVFSSIGWSVAKRKMANKEDFL